ncbi:MAG: hypothetical protein KAX49_18725 [Halanaerobiales bacterium]|nr:hypothetical protein [Halanaerobiales bacterium]
MTALYEYLPDNNNPVYTFVKEIVDEYSNDLSEEELKNWAKELVSALNLAIK